MKLTTLYTLLFISLFILSCLSQEEEEVDSCAAEEVSSYNLNFHIIGLFIILCTSSFGIGLTMLLGNFIQSPFMKSVTHMCKMFGIGIMAATAWIHLLPDAFEQFGNSCLDASWQEYGAAYAGLFGIIATFMVQIIEFTISSIGGLSHAQVHNIVPTKSIQPSDVPSSISSAASDNETVSPVNNKNSNAPKNKQQVELSHVKKNELEVVTVDLPTAEFEPANNHYPRDPALSVILLEVGIIIHSFIIGLTLGTSGDSVYLPLLIAIVFHQVFEGMALGALISMLKIETPYFKAMMFVMYPIITPFGNAIGIAIRENYNENNSSTILVQGILGSISAGILIYNTYSELMVSEINHSHSFHKLSTLEKNASFFFMYFGAACMAILAIWA